MSEQANNPKHECKCIGDKKVKALEKQIAKLKDEIAQLRHDLQIIRKVLTR